MSSHTRKSPFPREGQRLVGQGRARRKTLLPRVPWFSKAWFSLASLLLQALRTLAEVVSLHLKVRYRHQRVKATFPRGLGKN